MAVKLKADGTGTVAIYTFGDGVPENDLPFTTPLSDLSRLRFHSNLLTPSIVSTITASFVLPALPANTSINTKHTLVAHNQPGTPLILGQLTNVGGGIALAGSIPLSMGTVADNFGAYRWITLGADSTNIVLHENSDTLSATQAAPPGAITLNITVDVFDLLMDNSILPGPGTSDKHFEFTPLVMRARRGAFDTSKRYLRVGASGSTFPLAIGRTVQISASEQTSGTSPTHIRYSVNGYTKSSAGNGSTFVAPVQLVKK
jgi:hypothetical protein